jgi:nuclear pore complex protein Nup205
MLLLLLWRHLLYYSDERETHSTQIKASTPHIARLVASMDVDAFKAEVQKKLAYVLQRLESLELVSDLSCVLFVRC